MPSGLSDSLGASFGPIATYALAAIIVFGLLIVVLAVAKRTLRPGVASSSLRRGPRLAVIDVTAVDQRRKLVLVRRDDVEHLVLIGGQNDLVVEGGILRVPASSSQFPAESTGLSRFDAGNGHASDRRPSVVAPDPRPQSAEDDAPRASSPLRRPVPSQQVSQRRRATPAEARDEAPLADDRLAPPPVPQEAPAVHPGPLLEPAILDEVEPPARPQAPAAVPIEKPEREASPADAPRVTASERPQRMEAADRPVAPTRIADPAPERAPAIPAFLQRTDSAPETVSEPAAEPVSRPAPIPPVAPPASAVAARPAHAERSPPRPEPSQPVAPPPVRPSVEPVVPTIRYPFATPVAKPEPAAPVIPPVAQPVRPERVDPVATVAPPAPEVVPPAIEPGEEADRRPLSVRSFASAIQSRRTPPEPTPRTAPTVNSAVERPAERFRTTATPTYPAREVASPAAPTAAVGTPATDDSGLEDALSRELDSGFGSLDWGNDAASRDEKAQTVKPAVATPPPIVPERAQAAATDERRAAAPERKPTLEEEMERLLNDFDFGPPSR